jgi:hypothetical protein
MKVLLMRRGDHRPKFFGENDNIPHSITTYQAMTRCTRQLPWWGRSYRWLESKPNIFPFQTLTANSIPKVNPLVEGSCLRLDTSIGVLKIHGPPTGVASSHLELGVSHH